MVTLKQEVERKSKWFYGVKFFRSNSRVRKRFLNKIRFLASGFLFTCSSFTCIFTVFSFFGLDFFLDWIGKRCLLLECLKEGMLNEQILLCSKKILFLFKKIKYIL